VSEVNIRHRLRFYSLRRIDNQQGALARSEATRNFIAEIDVPGSIEQVQSIVLPGFARVMHRHWMRFDRDPALPLQVHRVKKLVLPIPLVDRAGPLEQSVRQRRFAVIDVRDDAEVAGKLNSHGSGHYASASARGQLVHSDLLAEIPEKIARPRSQVSMYVDLSNASPSVEIMEI
jgi:hypothetical protein